MEEEDKQIFVAAEDRISRVRVTLKRKLTH